MAKELRFADKASQSMIKRAAETGIDTVWDRYEAMQPQCGFGVLGICCKNCSMGPCRIDPFGDGPQVGVCGANADTIAAEVAGSMSIFFDVELIYCIDKEGVLRSKEKIDTVISKITRKSYQEYIRTRIISDGMIPKLHNAFRALDRGVKQIHIIHFNALERFNTNEMAGTTITES